jgi:hypothetical protein
MRSKVHSNAAARTDTRLGYEGGRVDPEGFARRFAAPSVTQTIAERSPIALTVLRPRVDFASLDRRGTG